MASIRDPKDTSGRLIAADQVEGTYIYNPAGDNLGSVQDVMIDKISGKIAYAVVGFGGFLGIGDRHYPLPWEKLKYRHEHGRLTWSTWTSAHWKARRPMPIAIRSAGRTLPGASVSMTTTARVPIGTCHSRSWAAASGPPFSCQANAANISSSAVSCLPTADDGTTTGVRTPAAGHASTPSRTRDAGPNNVTSASQRSVR